MNLFQVMLIVLIVFILLIFLLQSFYRDLFDTPCEECEKRKQMDFLIKENNSEFEADSDDESDIEDE
jgi:hypothetical protein